MEKAGLGDWGREKREEGMIGVDCCFGKIWMGGVGVMMLILVV